MEHPNQCPECGCAFASDPQWLLNGQLACNFCAYTKGNERFHKITYGITLGAIGVLIIYFASKIPNPVIQSFFPKADPRLKSFFLCGFGMIAAIAFILFFIPSLSLAKKSLQRISPGRNSTPFCSRYSVSGFRLALLTLGSILGGMVASLFLFSNHLEKVVGTGLACGIASTSIATFLILQKKIKIVDDFYFSITTPKRAEPQGESQRNKSPGINSTNVEFVVALSAFLFGALVVSNCIIPALIQCAYLWIVRPIIALSNTSESTERTPSENIQLSILFTLQRLGPAVLICLLFHFFVQSRQIHTL